MKHVTEHYKLRRVSLYVDPHNKPPINKNWINHGETATSCMDGICLSSIRPYAGGDTSTSGITTSPSNWSTSDRSFSLVKNEDDSAINRFSSDN